MDLGVPVKRLTVIPLRNPVPETAPSPHMPEKIPTKEPAEKVPA